MKYLFLDCFMFLSPTMLASALYDMTKNKDLLNKLCAPLKNAVIQSGEEKRCGMEAQFLRLDYETVSEEMTKEELCVLCERLDVSASTKEKLLKYIDLSANAKSIDPSLALFETKSATDSLIFTSYVLELVKELKTDTIYISKVLVPSPELNTQDMAQKLNNSMYILNKHNISHSLTAIDAPSYSEEWAAMISVLNPTTKSSNPGDIISIGYGAGEDETKETPNILRAVYGQEDDSDIIFEAEEALKLNFNYA